MNKTLRIILIGSLTLLVGGGLFLGGMFFSRMVAGRQAGFGWGDYDNDPGKFDENHDFFGRDGMMGGFFKRGDSNDGWGMMDGGYGQGMIGGNFFQGMMGGAYSNNQEDVAPLSVADARDAVQSYLSSRGDDNLKIKEIMIFSNNAYAVVVEESTGIGAFELLVDPVTKNVYPEYGPNMMWNTKYGMHSGFGGHGMMMGGWYPNQGQTSDVAPEMTVTTEKALKAAQAYLDANQPGVKVSEEITAFYGYYTIDLEKDGQITGMLSVNGYTAQVFPHTWHGTFVEMSEE